MPTFIKIVEIIFQFTITMICRNLMLVPDKKDDKKGVS